MLRGVFDYLIRIRIHSEFEPKVNPTHTRHAYKSFDLPSESEPRLTVNPDPIIKYALSVLCIIVISILMCILLFVMLNRTVADSDVVEDAKRVTLVDETDDSCTTHPPDRAIDDSCTPDFTGRIAEVKQELLKDVKVEDARENVEYRNLSVKVRAYVVPVLMFMRPAALRYIC